MVLLDLHSPVNSDVLQIATQIRAQEVCQVLQGKLQAIRRSVKGDCDSELRSSGKDSISERTLRGAGCQSEES